MATFASIFGGRRVSLRHPDTRTRVVYAFGGAHIDLDGTAFRDNEAYIDIYGAFGAVIIHVDNDVAVKFADVCILGSSEDKTIRTVNSDLTRTLTIGGVHGFGGVTVTNK